MKRKNPYTTYTRNKIHETLKKVIARNHNTKGFKLYLYKEIVDFLTDSDYLTGDTAYFYGKQLEIK